MKDAEAQAPGASPEAGLKRDSVGLLGTIGIAVGPQAPTGGINLLPAVMAGIVGAPASLAFLLGLGAMLFVAYAFVIFSRRIASAGQLYSYTSVAAGSAYGAVTGFVWMVAFTAVAAWLCIQDGDYLVALFQPTGTGSTLVLDVASDVGDHGGGHVSVDPSLGDHGHRGRGRRYRTHVYRCCRRHRQGWVTLVAVFRCARSAPTASRSPR